MRSAKTTLMTAANFKLGALAAATALALVIGMPSAQADDSRPRTRAAQAAQPAERHARPNLPRGDRTVHVERQRTDNGHTSQRVVTGPNGRTASRDAVVQNDPQAGTRTRDVTYTGPNGNVRTVNDATQRTDDGYTRTTTATGPKGTATREVTVSCDRSAGNCTKDVTVGTEGNAGN